MDTYQDAVANTMAAIAESRTLALKLWEQRQAGNDNNPELASQLHEACMKWDEYSAAAVQLAPDLNSFRLARKLAPEDGRAQSTVPAYLQERQLA